MKRRNIADTYTKSINNISSIKVGSGERLRLGSYRKLLDIA